MTFLKNIIMQAIKRQAVATFSGSNSGEKFESNIARLLTLMNRLRQEDVALDLSLLDPTKREAPVTYVEILHHPQFTISMFVLREGTRIPLHDHPGMHGILKVVHGKIAIHSYTISGKTAEDILSGANDVWACAEDKVTLHETSKAVHLQPTFGNLHEISAEHDGPAAFVDVLSPPYDDLERTCHYYCRIGEKDGMDLLRRTDRDHDFWTDCAPYRGEPL